MQIDIAKLKEARIARGMSQEDAAEAAGISARTLQRIETGQPASFETARALAALFETLGVDVRMTGAATPDPGRKAPPPAPPAPRGASAGARWSRRGITLGGTASLAGIVIGFAQGGMTSGELGAGLGLLGLGVGVAFLIVEILDRTLYR